MAVRQKSKARTFPSRIDLPSEKREHVVEQLNGHLADTFDLMSQTKQAHWNVKGKDFYQLHLLFDEIAGELAEFVDEIAERVTALGGYATGTVRMAAAGSSLPEYPSDAVEGMEHVEALVERFSQYAARVRQGIDDFANIGDQATSDLLTEITRTTDKRLWFLEAHLQDQES
jgi:starvation-inducible DNA-binding protein